MRWSHLRQTVVVIGLSLPSIVGWGQSPAEPAAAQASPLGVRQQRVERMVEELQRKFTLLTQALQEKEPERAARLKKTLDEVKNMLLQQRAGEIAKLLDRAQLETASDGQKAVLADIRALLALLLDERNDKEKNREEFERLQQWKQDIEKLVRNERGEKRESDKIASKDKTLADLAARIKAIEAIIERQTEVVAATEAARGEGIQGLGKIASQQAGVRAQTASVADAIATEAGDATKPSDPALPEPGSENASATAKSARPPEPAEVPLKQAIDHQRAAENSLQQGKGKAAQQNEQAALEELERALKELGVEATRIASLPPDAFEKMAGKQDDIANQTERVQAAMKQAAEQAAGDSESGGSGSGKQPPGEQRVQQAQKSMQQASGDLRKQDPSDASRQQGKAIKELEEALREIEERLAQLREETQIEKLARLEARFREMLVRQQKASAETIGFAKQLLAEEELKRSDRLALGKVAAEERALAEAAQQALDIIIDDGTSVVFPDVIEQLRDDLNAVSELILAKRIDAYTQSQQKEIELTLEELIEALQQAQQQKEGSGGGGGGGGGEPPLLPGSAELKLLRAAQLRVNRRTLAFDSARAPGSDLDDVMKREITNIGRRQAEIGDMTIRILERGQ